MQSSEQVPVARPQSEWMLTLAQAQCTALLTQYTSICRMKWNGKRPTVVSNEKDKKLASFNEVTNQDPHLLCEQNLQECD